MPEEMPIELVQALIPILVPLLVDLAVQAVGRLPKWTVPVLLVPALGMAGQAVAALALEFQVDPLVGVVLGGVGLWIHEVRDQLQKAGHARRMGVSTPVMGSRSWP